MDPLERLAQLEEINIIEDGLSNKDEDFVFQCLHHHDIHVVTRAALFLTALDAPVLLRVLKEFNKVPAEARHILIPGLACTDHYFTYKFLISLIMNDPNHPECDWVIACLSRTEYNILPLVLDRIPESGKEKLEKLKKILLGMGIDKIAPLIAMFPRLPFENLFRELFGDAEIEKLK